MSEDTVDTTGTETELVDLSPLHQAEETKEEMKVEPEVEGAEAAEVESKKTGSGQYFEPALIPKEKMGFGPGKCGLAEVQISETINFNPWVALIGAVTLWGFAIWCVTDEEAGDVLGVWKAWCTKTFSWFYIASQNFWIVFLFIIYYYYGNVKLGKDHEKPEFDNLTYFAMLFSAGVAVGLFVFGTAEPLYHYDYWLANRWSGSSLNQNDKANYALLLTLFHWGFHGWCVYTLVGLQMAIMSYRKNLPLLMRSAFYPLLGRHTWGIAGDLIDGFSMVAIVAGVCTSLGLGVIQIFKGLQGMQLIATDCSEDCQLTNYLIIIWAITAVATISVVSGVGVGIKTMSQLAFNLGLFLLAIVFFLGNTWFYLNNMSQMIGYYLQYSMTQLGWHTDAFAQLVYGEGGAPDQLGAAKALSGGTSFMDGWTIFYWGWWIAWSPFVGMFIARISRGRTIAEVINYTLVGPMMFSLIWFAIFGGAAIAMENNAQLLWRAGSDLYNDPTYFQTGQHDNPQTKFIGLYVSGPIDSHKNSEDNGFGTSNGRCGAWSFNATSNDTVICESGKTLQVAGCVPATAVVDKSKACGACFVQVATFDVGTKKACDIFNENMNNKGLSCPAYIQHWEADPELSPQCLFTDYDQEASWYNVMQQFGVLGEFLNVVSIVTLMFYFVTSSDSGSLVVDTLAGNGRDEQHWSLRVFWALTEGAVATALLVAGFNQGGGASSALKALQAASICSGLPFTFLLCFMMPAMWYGLQEGGVEKKHFKTPVYGGIFDYPDVVKSGFKWPLPDVQVHVVSFFVCLLCPPFAFLKIHLAFEQSEKPLDLCGSPRAWTIIGTIMTGILFYSWIILMLISAEVELIWGLGWVCYLVFATSISAVRSHCRFLHGISGNFAEDFFSALILYPQVLVQVLEAMADQPAPVAEKEE